MKPKPLISPLELLLLSCLTTVFLGCSWDLLSDKDLSLPVWWFVAVCTLAIVIMAMCTGVLVAYCSRGSRRDDES